MPSPEPGSGLIARLRWRSPSWRPGSTTRAKYFAREADAQKAAAKLRADGHLVEVSIAERSPWTVVGGQILGSDGRP